MRCFVFFFIAGMMGIAQNSHACSPFYQVKSKSGWRERHAPQHRDTYMPSNTLQGQEAELSRSLQIGDQIYVGGPAVVRGFTSDGNLLLEYSGVTSPGVVDADALRWVGPCRQGPIEARRTASFRLNEWVRDRDGLCGRIASFYPDGIHVELEKPRSSGGFVKRRFYDLEHTEQCSF